MSAETEASLREWQKWFEDGHKCVEEEVHNHFESMEPGSNWCGIADEGVRIYNLMFRHLLEDEVQDGSPLASLIGGVSAQAYASAVENIGRALGLNKRQVNELHDIAERGERGEMKKMPQAYKEFAKALETASGEARKPPARESSGTRIDP